MEGIEELLKSLSPIERRILPFLACRNIDEIIEKSKEDRTVVLRALEFLANKGVVKISYSKGKNVVLGANGILYIKQGLPERRLLNILAQTLSLGLDETKKTGLSENELKAAIGALKRKALATLENGKLMLQAKKDEISKKMLEEQFLEQLPIELEKLTSEQKYSLEQLKNRKDIIRIEETRDVHFEITELGRKLEKEDLSKLSYVEQLTSEMLKKKAWKGKQFRKYDILSPVPKIFGGRRQPYLSFLQGVREKLVALGFEEMSGSLVENEFWNYDALFQPQFHVAREWSSTYYVKNRLKAEAIDKKIVEGVKQQHEKSWHYRWQLQNALKLILRPQGTVLSARQLPKAKIPGKYFAIARCYRPDVIDAKHLSEFNQVEGIIVQENLTLRNLFYILELFAKEIGHIKEIKFVPHYFPFTEPSVELHGRHPKFGWIELGGAGIFRREVVMPLLGKDITVLAWGLGIDRLAMYNLGVEDIRQLFSQDLDFLRGVK